LIFECSSCLYLHKLLSFNHINLKMLIHKLKRTQLEVTVLHPLPHLKLFWSQKDHTRNTNWE
jgi:hypothetical protein